ncbi:MAG: preprotein translocase subunit SecA [Deltaproteobacteria bacterium]|nr:preprotein translocase subunit SecA [Deltaproteobacteria bacterium]
MILPAQDYRRTHIVIPEKLPEALDGVANGLVGRFKRRPKYTRILLDDAQKISEKSNTLRNHTTRQLRDILDDMQAQFRRAKKGYEQVLSEALSALTEAAHRTTGLRPYPVQIAGAMALYKGYLTEMATGEGKSLTACLPAVLAAWTGRPCHIVTVNDYLAERDTEEMQPFYSLCGVTAGCVTSLMQPKERRENYAKGVVYTTSKELVADFLRDRLIIGAIHQPSRRLIRTMLFPGRKEIEGLVMRGLDTAIVDEADSVLIDEAVTPLIISRSQENKPLANVCRIAHEISSNLIYAVDYHTDIKYKEINLTKEGFQKIENLAHNLPGIWRSPSRREELITQALTGREFYHLDEQYVIQDGKIIIVDEFTGRLMPNRSWRQGLHQAVEAKEGLDLTNPTETLARLSFQQFFRLFRKLSGMTGTASEAAGEFWQIYGLPVVKIPTNRPCIRKLYPDQIFASAELKWQAIVKEIIAKHKTGRPVLVGTRNVYASENLAKMLSGLGFEYNLLNAVHHKEEAEIVRMAGEEARITIATNMAGRGTDIKLSSKVAKAGGLHVIATERYESGRIDRQLFGRCARQGDPGSAQAFMSVEDELIQRFIPKILQKSLSKAVEKNRPGVKQLAGKTVILAQYAAQHLAYKQRKSVMLMDTWLEEALSFSGTGSLSI